MRSCTVFPSTDGLVTPAAIQVQYSCDRSGESPIPVQMSMNFESPISEWHLTVLGERYLGDVDIFRDIYLRLPNDGLHETATVFLTSLMATWQHWVQHFTSGIPHLLGRLYYGNVEVFARFAKAAMSAEQPRDVSSEDALAILRMQYEIINAHEVLI